MSAALYVEAPRGYRGLLVTAVLLAAVVAADGAIGGLDDHWPAWAVTAVVLLGVHALFVHAARVNKTLTITADEVRIGEETLARADLAAATVGITDRDLPVLGWPAGAPARLAGVTVRLHDDRQAVVPTRNGPRVLAALGLAPADDADVRIAGADDLDLLAEIDERAEAVFRVAGYELPAQDAKDDWGEAAAIFVASRPVVGFARVDIVDGGAHLSAMAVLPGSMRRGVGGALLDAVCDWSRAAGYAELTLTTFADVPWNGPMYARRGWIESTALGSELAAIRTREVADGLDAVGRRIVMRRRL